MSRNWPENSWEVTGALGLRWSGGLGTHAVPAPAVLC